MESFAGHYGSMYQTIQRYMPGADMELIHRAVEYAREKHKDQKRKDGSPYIIHPLAVAEIVAEKNAKSSDKLPIPRATEPFTHKQKKKKLRRFWGQITKTRLL